MPVTAEILLARGDEKIQARQEHVLDSHLEPLRSALAAHHSLLAGPHSVTDLGLVLDELVDQGLDRIPLPGWGQTLERWRVLALVAAASLPLVKIFEGHTDALAICSELGVSEMCRTGTWGVYAAESKSRPLRFIGIDREVLLEGEKYWCSGGSILSHALVTACSPEGENFLVAVALDPHFVKADTSQWAAVGMRATGTANLTFSECPGRLIGAANSYIERAGFWQGAIGVAACWYGAALEIATRLRSSLRIHKNEHALAHLGATVALIDAARAAFLEAARRIDRKPGEPCPALALAVRATAESMASQILEHAGRALGAAPFCMDAHFAALSSDLPVFMRQSHAERDLAALGQMALEEELPWEL